MPAGDISLSFKDGALGQVANSIPTTRWAIGVCSAGTANTIYAINSIDDAVNLLGTGPLSAFAAHDVQIAGPGLLAIPVTPSVAAATSAVTSTPGGATALALTSSSPNDSYELLVTITTSGAVGAAKFTYSLDGGYTTSQPITTAATYDLTEPVTGKAAGVKLNFSGTYTAGVTYVARTFAAAYVAADLATAHSLIAADYREAFTINYVGATMASSTNSTNLTANATLATALGTQADTTFANSSRFVASIMDASDIYVGGVADSTFDTAVGTAFASVASTRLWYSPGGQVRIVDPRTNLIQRRPASWPISARVHRNIAGGYIQRDPAWVGSEFGPLNGVHSIIRDERAQPAYHDARALAVRTHLKKPGVYAASSVGLASPGSDYTYLPNRIVMDHLAGVIRAAAINYLNQDLTVNADGTIASEDAAAIESDLNGVAIRESVAPGFISPPTSTTPIVTVNRTNNILSTGQLLIRVRATPKGYARAIQVDIGFTVQNTNVASN